MVFSEPNPSIQIIAYGNLNEYLPSTTEYAIEEFGLEQDELDEYNLLEIIKPILERKDESTLNKNDLKLVKNFLLKLNNVAIVVEKEPTPAQIRKLKIRPGWTLFGLYEGVPQAARGSHYSALPDKITIFQKPIEQAARDTEDMKEIVKNTVWHEIAHHFGMGEARVRQAETRRKR